MYYAIKILNCCNLVYFSLIKFPPVVPLIDGPTSVDKEATPSEHDITIVGHHVLPDDFQVQLEPLFKQLLGESTSVATPTIIPPDPVAMETVIAPNMSLQSGGEGGVVGLSVSVVVLLFGSVLFSTLLASLVAIMVTKMTSGKLKEIHQV